MAKVTEGDIALTDLTSLRQKTAEVALIDLSDLDWIQTSYFRCTPMESNEDLPPCLNCTNSISHEIMTAYVLKTFYLPNNPVVPVAPKFKPVVGAAAFEAGAPKLNPDVVEAGVPKFCPAVAVGVAKLKFPAAGATVVVVADTVPPRPPRLRVG